MANNYYVTKQSVMGDMRVQMGTVDCTTASETVATGLDYIYGVSITPETSDASASVTLNGTSGSMVIVGTAASTHNTIVYGR
jgi:hypothetical protein